jgi:GT2 family glycosyltransferase
MTEERTAPVDLSIIILSFNTLDITRKCLSCIEQFRPDVHHEVLVVDNASRDRSAEMVEREFPWVTLIRLQKNKGFAGGNNEGICRASGRYILLLNSDAFIAQGVIDSTLAYMQDHPSAGVLGCLLTNPDGSRQPSARMLPGHMNKFFVMTGLTARFHRSRLFGRVDYSWWDHSHPRPVGWVVGAYFLIRREVLDGIGMLDERYFLYFEEIDFCRAAAKAGWDVIFYPHARVVHLGGQSAIQSEKRVSSTGRQSLAERIRSEFRYYRKWNGITSVLLSALLETAWKTLVFVKNLASRSRDAARKRQEACLTVKMIISILFRDRFGKGADA